MAGHKVLDIALKAAEQQGEREMTSRLSARLAQSVKELGAVDTMRHTILSYVAKESYDRAIEELNKYSASKAAYPQFLQRSDRYIKYGIDLINAIKVKRSFPGLQHLAMSKQQELFDRAMGHFEDLKATLKKVEQIDQQVKIEDIRSTVLVVKAVIYCCIAVVIVGFMKELSRGVVPSANILLDSLFGNATNWLFDKIGF